jgi:hypothetical protein
MYVVSAERVERSALVLNLSQPSKAPVRGMSYQDLLRDPDFHASGQDDRRAMQRQRRHREAEMSRRVISARLLSGDLLGCRLRVKMRNTR